MVVKFCFVFIYFILALSVGSSVEVVNGRIKVSTVTTSGCINTVRFILDQLVPAYQLYGDFMDLEFIPWGRTVNHGNGTLTCQFGANDCFANRMHRCILNHLRGNQKAQLDYMKCEFTAPYAAFGSRSYSCARATGMNIVNIDYCVNNPNADTLDDDAEAAAAEPMRIINLVPAIVLNDKIDPEARAQARNRLPSVICFALAEIPDSGVDACQI